MAPLNPQKLKEILEQKQLIKSLTPEGLRDAQESIEHLLKNITSPNSSAKQKELINILLDTYSEILKRQTK